MSYLWAFDLISSPTQLLLFFIVFLLPFFILRWFKEKKYPPGPTGLPLLGYLPFLGPEPNKKLLELSKKYGNIMSVYFGPRRAIIITDYKLAKEAIAHPSALARPVFPEMTPGNGGFVAANGEAWVRQRRYAMHTMRDLGLGRGTWENIIQEYAEEFAEEMKKWKGKTTAYKDQLVLSQASNIVALLIGRRLPMDESHPDVKLLLQTLEAILDVATPSALTVIAPSLIKYLIRLPVSKYYKMSKIFRQFENLVRKEIDNRINAEDTGMQNDYIGQYLQEIEKQEKFDEVQHFNVDSLTGSVLNLFVGGTDTTTTSLYFLLLFMASCPNVQKRVHEEIDSTVGRENRVYWDERNKLPYTMAAIMEMERWIAITPLLPARMVTDDFEVGGYILPKGSLIMCNLWAIMRDPRHFKDPHNYHPEHFLTEDGKSLVKPESYLPFSFGKRNCPGETVAMMSIFIYFVSIMQKFMLKTPDGKPTNFEMTFTTTICPKYPQKLCFMER